jgi:hypothetical protein
MQTPKDEVERKRWAREWESGSCGENWDVCTNGTLKKGGEIVRRRPHTLTILPNDLRSSGTRMHLVWENSEWRLDETVCNPHRRISKNDARRQLMRAAPKVRGDPVATVVAFWKNPQTNATSTLLQRRMATRAPDAEDVRCALRGSDVMDVWYRGIESTHVDIIVAGTTAFVYVRLVPERGLWRIDSVVCEDG